MSLRRDGSGSWDPQDMAVILAKRTRERVHQDVWCRKRQVKVFSL